jgi:hypothetical protein
MHGKAWLIVLSAAIAVLSLGGCGSKGPQNYRVFGTVNFKGAPLAEGVIMFAPAEGNTGASTSIPIKDGKYESAAGGGLPPGRYKVMISAGAGGGAPKNPDEPPGISDVQKELIPEKYNVRSDIIREVQPNNNNQFDFDIR